MNNLYGKKIFLDNQNSISIVEKLKHKYRDVSMLESVIGGDNKGRFTIIFFNSREEIKIFENEYSISNFLNKLDLECQERKYIEADRKHSKNDIGARSYDG